MAKLTDKVFKKDCDEGSNSKFGGKEESNVFGLWDLYAETNMIRKL